MVLLAIALPLSSGLAQRASVGRSFAAQQPAAWRGSAVPHGDLLDRLRPRQDSSRETTAWAVLASAIVPGTGQALLGQDRVVAYLAVEAYAWARYAADAKEGQRARGSYRNLASEVARRPFSATRPIGDFDYYERMEKFVSSGAFDVIPGGDLNPETDTTTANGAIWLLARQTFWANPSTPPRDEAEYQERGDSFIGPSGHRDYRWSWSNARLEYAEFRRTIRRSNNAYRTSLQDLGVVIANHALSTVDAFITVTTAASRGSGIAAVRALRVIPDSMVSVMRPLQMTLSGTAASTDDPWTLAPSGDL